MLSSVLSQITTAMAAEGVGNGKVVVSKRSARTYIEDEMELSTTVVSSKDNQLVRTSTTSTKQSPSISNENMIEELRGRKHSTSTTSSSGSGQSSRQTSIEAQHSPMAAAVVEKEAESVTAGGFLEAQGDGAFAIQQQQQQSSAFQFDETLPKTGRPANFGVVVPGVYRSSFPQVDDHEFIGRLGLKTIVTLVQKDFPEGYDAFIHKNKIKHHVFDMRGTKKERIPDKTMKAILGLVMNQANHPLLIHCNHGKHRTGCVVAVVRILTGWDMGHVVDEYRSFAEPKVRECDIEYIRGFEPGRISNLFVRDGVASLRFRRAVCFVVVVLIVWFASGRSITGTVSADRRLL
ncbi:Tyrosine phosphatase family domain containing protein [Rhypophila sp. PSN 637]